jgi:hypothetical protein
MAIPKHLSVFLLVLSLTASRPVFVNNPDCNSFDFRTEISKNLNEELYKLTITATGGRRPYHYLLLDEKNSLVSKDFSKSVFEGLKKGRYRCIISDDQDCTKEQFIEVK